MAKSRKRHRDPVPSAAARRASAFPDGRRVPPISFRAPNPRSISNSFLAKASNTNPILRDPAVPGISAGAATSPDVSSAQAREAERCARDGARLINEGRPAEAIPLLQRSIELNPGAAMSHHDLGVALTAAARWEQAVEAFTAALRL